MVAMDINKLEQDARDLIKGFFIERMPVHYVNEALDSLDAAIQSGWVNTGNHELYKQLALAVTRAYDEEMEDMNQEMKEEEKMGKMKDIHEEVRDLNFDYAIWVGNQATGHSKTEPIEALHPAEYLDAFMEMHCQPPKEACRQFLLQFMKADEVVDWMMDIAWAEDEIPEDQPITFSESELHTIIRAVQTIGEMDKDTYYDSKEEMAEEERRGFIEMRDDSTRALRKLKEMLHRQAK